MQCPSWSVTLVKRPGIHLEASESCHNRRCPHGFNTGAQGSESTPQGEGQGTTVKAKGLAAALQPRPRPACRLPRPVVQSRSAERLPAWAPGDGYGWALQALAASRPRGQRGTGRVLGAAPGTSSALTVQTGTGQVSVVPFPPQLTSYLLFLILSLSEQLCVVTFPEFSSSFRMLDTREEPCMPYLVQASVQSMQ